MSRTSGFGRDGGPRRSLGGRVAVGTALAGLMLFIIPAGAAGREPTPNSFSVTGTVNWSGADSRATLEVWACPVDDEGAGCPGLRKTTVAADRSYSLVVPYGQRSTWKVFAAATVGTSAPPLSFAVGTPTEVTVPRSPNNPVPLTISTHTVGLRVVDDGGNVFPEGTASVMAVPTSSGEWSVAGADANGDVLLFVDPAIEYRLNAFATNTGWPDPWASPDGTEFHFSQNEVTAFGAAIQEGTTFVVARPAGVLVRVVDGNGNPFPAGTAGVSAHDMSGVRGSVEVDDTDGDGDVLLSLDPTTQWWIIGRVTNTGWPDPSWVAEDGTEFHFSEPLILDPGTQLDEGTVFVIAEPGTA